MMHALFFTAAAAAGLLWTATLVALAARTRRSLWRRILISVGLAAPLVAWLPWVVISGVLAYGLERFQLETTWFPQALAVLVIASGGGLIVARCGLRQDTAAASPRGSSWPLRWLVAGFVVSKVTTALLVAVLDQAVLGEAAVLRQEAADLIESNLPPRVGARENAATLYQQAFANLHRDPAVNEVLSRLTSDEPIDLADEMITSTLFRHAETLAILNRAASRDVCRFARDWTRPSYAMPLPEIQALRQAAQLVVVAARRHSLAGERSLALEQISVLRAFARHAASEPLLISVLVGQATDTLAYQTLAELLPQLTAEDSEALAAFRLPPPDTSLQAAFLGEEAFGLSAYADLAAGVTNTLTSLGNTGKPAAALLSGRQSPLGSLFRAFLLPGDLAGYRRFMHAHQQLAAEPRSWQAMQEQVRTLHNDLNQQCPGIVCGLLLPALDQVHQQTFETAAQYAAASILVAATRQRLDTGSLPASLTDIDPGWLPLPPTDPFTGTTLSDQAPLHYRSDEDGLWVWSVGPNGVDYGGPAPKERRTPRDLANDDIGLLLPMVPSPK